METTQDTGHEDYGNDVEAFNRDHKRKLGCSIGRTAGGDTTECDTHHAVVSHGVPIPLRTGI